MKVFADLHMHTTASDGRNTVSERVEQARESDLEAISVTDHDTIPSELGSRYEKRNGVQVITGVEVRADLFDTKIEILGYYVDPSEKALRDVLQRARDNRRNRNREMVENVREIAGMKRTYGELKEEADGSLGRPHMARALVEEGIVDSLGEAFDEYLADDGECYVPMERVPYEDVMDAVHEANGVASLAHPGRIRTDTEEVREMIEELSSYGLDGIEVWYPYGDISSSDAYADIGIDDAEELAEEFGLLRTGGSDCHGQGSDKFRIGSVGVSKKDFEKLRERAGVAVS